MNAKTDAKNVAMERKQKVENWMGAVVKRQQTFQRLLPKGLDAEWYIGEIRVALARSPSLADCDEVSVFDALTTCAQLGLSPSGRLSSAYLIPFKGKCTLVIGYKGFVDLAYRSGEVVGFAARVVYEKDEFEYEDGLEPRLRHVPSEEADPGPMRAVYAVGALRGGYKTFVVMLAREVLAIKARSPGAKQAGGPWQTDEGEMWKKTAIRRLIKLLPLSPQKAQGLNRAQEVEDAEWEAMPESQDTAEAEAPQSRTNQVKARLGAGQPRETLEAPRTIEPVHLDASNYHEEPPDEPGSNG